MTFVHVFCINVYVHVCVHMPCVWGAHRDQGIQSHSAEAVSYPT